MDEIGIDSSKLEEEQNICRIKRKSKRINKNEQTN